MDWLHGVADVVEEAVEGFKGPAGAAEGLPDGGVVGEGSEGDEGVVGRAAAEDFGARVTDVRVSCMSHGSVNGVIRVLIPPFLKLCRRRGLYHLQPWPLASIRVQHMYGQDADFYTSSQCHLLTIRLLGSTIIIVQLATKEVQPIFEVQDLVVHEIAWASFN